MVTGFGAPGNRFRRLGVVILSVTVATLGPAPVARAQVAGRPVDRVREALRERLEAVGSAGLVVSGDPIYSRTALPQFYERRTYVPAWSDDRGPLPRVNALLESIESARREGLNPEDYHLSAIRSTLQRVVEARRLGRADVAALVDLDLLASDAFLVYGAHLVSGRVDPVSIHPAWTAVRRERDLVAVLDTALLNDGIGAALRSLLPDRREYFGLRDALARYREMADSGGWPQVPAGPKLEVGSSGARVAVLRRRLAATGALHDALAQADTFDTALADAVRRFQSHQGLDVDGAVGPATLAALNVPVKDRIAQIEANMERWRWLPEDLGRRYIVVNIADFTLTAVESTSTALKMRVVVGQRYHATPVFSDTMRYVVLNPYWNVPTSIAVREILPLVRKDPAYLTRQNMEVLSLTGNVPIDPATIDWRPVDASRFPYRIRQRPGPWNALGQMKFMFPNPYNVYLHDTPARQLFSRSARGFSHGCIRLEKPLDLLAYVLRDNPAWTKDGIDSALDSRTETTIRIAEPIPVHILYWTAWADADGSIQFRDDIYGRDGTVERALHAAPPGIQPGAARP
ncbi:MAG: L,D-transpeptidase family protein [Gemmatimonadota bacterium]